MATSPTSQKLGSRWIRVWDLPLRLFHWGLVVAIAVAFLSSEEDSALNQWHVLAGWIVAILIVFRLAWGVVGGEHSRFVDFVRPSRIGHHLGDLLGGQRERSVGHNPLGALAVVALLLLAAATVWTGAFGGEAAEDLHETIAWVLLAMVAVHVLAVVVMSVLERENLVRAMVSGDKPASLHPGTVHATRPGIVGLAVAALVVLGTVWLILQYDPQAFTLRSAESFEDRGYASGSLTPYEEREGGDED